MREETDLRNSSQALRRQLANVEHLRNLPFDDPSYEEWRTEIERILNQAFGQLQSEQHPCTKAFLDYRVPERFTASRAEMQEYYRNIIRYQADLLWMYLDDIQDSNSSE